jgi:hypothetical protein|tara:strand:+ start:217 stop:915 length:699 start_codon:yes stop_codon:yes gene_type:complete
MEFNLPASLRDVKLSQWQRYIDVFDKNKGDEATEFLNKKVLEIFCDIKLSDIHHIGLSLFEDSLAHLSAILNSKPELSQTFKLEGSDGVVVEFGMIPNLDKMSYGEFIDLEKYLFSDKDLHKAMAVLYRPIKLKKKDRYLIHDYKGTSYMSDVMKDTPLDVAISARVFFYRLATKLGNYTMAYTLKQLQEKNQNKQDKDSVKNGEVIKQYLLSLEKMLAKSEKLQNFQFINV